jgi:hypothetical protein
MTTDGATCLRHGGSLARLKFQRSPRSLQKHIGRLFWTLISWEALVAGYNLSALSPPLCFSLLVASDGGQPDVAFALRNRWSNKPDAVNPAMALRLTIEDQWRRVTMERLAVITCMNRPSTSLSPSWHIPGAVALTFAVASPFMSMAWPHASKLRADGHTGLALYFTSLGVAFWFLALLILLPRRRNASSVAVVRALGRLPLVARYFLAFAASAALFWLGILYEKITG